METPKFLAYQNKSSNNIIKTQLDIVCEEILKNIENVKSIILAGGFGRGEGSVKISEDKIIPINDYDIYVITEKTVSEEKIKEVSIKAEQRIGTSGTDWVTGRSKFFQRYSFEKSFYVDIKCMPLNKLKKLVPMIRYLELKHTGMVLYGEDLSSYIPDYKVEELPLEEGLRLLFNRMSHLTGWMSPRFLKRNICEEDHDTLDNISYNCAKTFLSICEALLLLSKKYKPTYSERMHIFKESFEEDFPDLYCVLPDLPEKVSSFTRLKLKTDFGIVEDPIKLWFLTREYLGVVIGYFLMKYLQKKGKKNDWMNLMSRVRMLGKTYFNPYIKFHFRNNFHIKINDTLVFPIAVLAQVYLNAKYIFRIRKANNLLYLRPISDWVDPGLKIFAALPPLTFSIDEEGNVDMNMLRVSINCLKRVYPVNVDMTDEPLVIWNNVKLAYRDAYKLYYFQKIM